MPYCPECNEEVDEGVRICPNCGTEIPKVGKIGATQSVEKSSGFEGVFMTRYRTMLSVFGGFLLLLIGQMVLIALESFKIGLAIYQIGIFLFSAGLVGGGLDDNNIDDVKQIVMIITGVAALLILNMMEILGPIGAAFLGGGFAY